VELCQLSGPADRFSDRTRCNSCARRKARIKHGGEKQRVDLEAADVPVRPPAEEILALNGA
jgi:hypothetical protein